MVTPITKRVKKAREGTLLPINQEVTKNADGTGGPIDGIIIVTMDKNQKKSKKNSNPNDFNHLGFRPFRATVPVKNPANTRALQVATNQQRSEDARIQQSIDRYKQPSRRGDRKSQNDART